MRIAILGLAASLLATAALASEDTIAANVRVYLRDPSSAQFRYVIELPRSSETLSKPIACGEVNSKNGYGGYTGFQRFLLYPDHIYLENETMRMVFDPLWKVYCG